MADKRLLKLYHCLPAWAQSAAASAHGYRLRRSRYGPDLEAQVERAFEREFWTTEQWDVWRSERLARILTAASRVPYYRNRGPRRPGDGPGTLENWPILEKDDLRAEPRAFLADGADPRRMVAENTSGTTGKPLQLWLSREAVREWYALAEARWRRWYGVSIRDRWGILGGQLVTPAARRKPPFWVWNAAFKQLYLSSYHLSPDLLPHYLDALRKYRVRYLVGYSSSLYAMARAALDAGRGDIALKVVITNAEPLLAHQRETIGKAFQCPVRETYGMSENVAAASECEHGRRHLWPEAGWLEVLRDGEIHSAGQGELLATGLLNPQMPLIRYRVGDSVTLSREASCQCGRNLPLLESVEGRTDDLLRTADGRLVGRMDPVFKGTMPLREAQIIQEDLDLVRVLYVPAPGFSKDTTQQVRLEIQARLGLVRVEFEEVREVPRGANGKFRAVLCRIPSRHRIQAEGPRA